MKVNQIRAGVILSYLAQVISIFSGLIYTPIMLRLLGQSEYGLYQLSASVISYLGVLNFGFASGYLRIYFRYKQQNDNSAIARLNGMYLIIFTVISIATSICGSILIQYADVVFGNNLSPLELIKAKKLMVIMIAGLITAFMSSVFDCYLSAYQQFVFQRGLQVVKAFLNPFICVPLLLQGYGSIGLAYVSFGLTLGCFLLSVWFCKKKIRMNFCFRGIEKSVFREVSSFTFYIFISSVVDKINLSLDNFLLGRLSGTISVAIYGVGSQINGFYYMISTTVASVFAPEINKIVASKEMSDQKLTDYFINVSMPLFLTLAIVLLGFTFFGSWFVGFWAGAEYYNSYYVALILMAGSFVSLVQVLGIEIQKAKNMHKARSIAYFLIAIGNVAISIPLIRYKTEIGASFGTFIAMFLGSGLFMNYYYQKFIHLNMKKYWKEMIKLLKYLILPILIGLIYCCFDNNSTIFTLVFGGIFVLIFALEMFLYSPKNTV